VHAWLAALTLGAGLLLRGHAAVQLGIPSFDEINVHRINIVEPDGKPRVIISDRASMAGIYWGGKEYKHNTRDSGGFLFFNDDGDEAGGLMLTSRHKGDQYGAASFLTLDHYKQQEALVFSYGEDNGKRQAGLHAYDQPTSSLEPLIQLSDQAARAATPAERAKIEADMKAQAQAAGAFFVQRFFAGKLEEDSIVQLADKSGKPRLVLKVSRAGAASVEFLDATGKVVQHLGPQ
jgi:hypothetical protein